MDLLFEAVGTCSYASYFATHSLALGVHLQRSSSERVLQNPSVKICLNALVPGSLEIPELSTQQPELNHPEVKSESVGCIPEYCPVSTKAVTKITLSCVLRYLTRLRWAFGVSASMFCETQPTSFILGQSKRNCCDLAHKIPPNVRYVGAPVLESIKLKRLAGPSGVPEYSITLRLDATRRVFFQRAGRSVDRNAVLVRGFATGTRFNAGPHKASSFVMAFEV